MDKDCIKYLDYFLETEYKNPDIDIFESILKLMSNACERLKKEIKPTIKNSFHLYYTAVKNLPIPVDNISYIDKSVFYLFINGLTLGLLLFYNGLIYLDYTNISEFY